VIVRTDLSSLSCPDGETEESGRLGVAVHLEVGERRRVPFDGLRTLSFHREQLHCTYDAVLLKQKIFRFHTTRLSFDWKKNIDKVSSKVQWN